MTGVWVQGALVGKVLRGGDRWDAGGWMGWGGGLDWEQRYGFSFFFFLFVLFLFCGGCFFKCFCFVLSLPPRVCIPRLL